MANKAYHGTTIFEIEKIVSGKSSVFPGLYITNTVQKAMQYANSRATGIVKNNYKELVKNAVIAELETEEDLNRRRRKKATVLTLLRPLFKTGK